MAEREIAVQRMVYAHGMEVVRGARHPGSHGGHDSLLKTISPAGVRGLRRAFSQAKQAFRQDLQHFNNNHKLRRSGRTWHVIIHNTQSRG